MRTSSTWNRAVYLFTLVAFFLHCDRAFCSARRRSSAKRIENGIGFRDRHFRRWKNQLWFW